MPPFVNRRTDARKIELMSSNVGLCEREKTKQQTDIRLFFFFQQLVLFRFDSILLVRFRCKPRPRAAVVASGIERRGGRHIAIVDEQFDVNASGAATLRRRLESSWCLFRKTSKQDKISRKISLNSNRITEPSPSLLYDAARIDKVSGTSKSSKKTKHAIENDDEQEQKLPYEALAMATTAASFRLEGRRRRRFVEATLRSAFARQAIWRCRS